MWNWVTGEAQSLKWWHLKHWAGLSVANYSGRDILARVLIPGYSPTAPHQADTNWCISCARLNKAATLHPTLIITNNNSELQWSLWPQFGMKMLCAVLMITYLVLVAKVDGPNDLKDMFSGCFLVQPAGVLLQLLCNHQNIESREAVCWIIPSMVWSTYSNTRYSLRFLRNT